MVPAPGEARHSRNGPPRRDSGLGHGGYRRHGSPGPSAEPTRGDVTRSVARRCPVADARALVTAPSSPVRRTAPPWPSLGHLGLLVCVLCAGCRGPSASVRVADDPQEIDAALQANARRLADAGIVVEPSAPETTPTEPPSADALDEQAPVEQESSEEPMEPSRPSEEAAPQSARPRPESTSVDVEAKRERRRGDDRTRTLCDLADATCELAARICSLRDRHPGDPRYQSACERGNAQCEAATDACEDARGS